MNRCARQTADPLGENSRKSVNLRQWVCTFGGFGVNLGALLVREPLNMRVNPLIRTQTPRHAPGRRCPGACHRARVRVIRPTCAGCVHRTRRGPDSSQVSRRPHGSSDTTEAGPRRGPPLVECGGCAAGTEKSRYRQHVESYDRRCERLRCPCPGLVPRRRRGRGRLSAVV